MSDQKKTTVYLEGEDYRRLKMLARERQVGAASLVREAVAEYVVRHARGRRPKSIGAGASVRRDVARQAERLLKGFGRK